MSKQIDQLVSLTREQRKLIKDLLSENTRLNRQTKALCKRVQDLERLQMIVDREIIEIPVGLDLVPEKDLTSY